MPKFLIRAAQRGDWKSIVEIYNSNPAFLRTHLGMERVDKTFVSSETEEMCRAGFRSCIIADGETSAVQGILDYRPGKEAYLSLLMLNARLQGNGLGTRIYADLERHLQKSGTTSIRIDVVNDYPGNALPFWKKLGFCEGERIHLNWQGKTSKAVVMRKNI